MPFDYEINPQRIEKKAFSRYESYANYPPLIKSNSRL